MHANVEVAEHINEVDFFVPNHLHHYQPEFEFTVLLVMGFRLDSRVVIITVRIEAAASVLAKAQRRGQARLSDRRQPRCPSAF